MNKDLLNQLPADEQPVASKLDFVAEDMKLSPSFQWELENQLMDAYKAKAQPAQGWQIKIIPALGWAIVAIGAVLLLNWTMRSQAPDLPPAAPATPIPGLSFEENIRQGNICADPLAVAHGFSVFFTNEDKTGFLPVDKDGTIGEMRSLAWSPDGKLLAVVGNTTGRGNIYFTDLSGGQLGYLLYRSELGYLMDSAWSRDGRQLLMWSSQNNRVIYLVNGDGTGLTEKQLDVQILGTPQFTPDGKSIVFYGAEADSAGLFEAMLDGSQTRLISDLVEDESGFAFSPDGLHLAYVDMDRNSGVAILTVQELETRAIITLLGGLPIPKGSGSSIPESANLSWSQDGKFLAFEFGRSEADRAVYLAHADGTGLVRVADAAHAPAISADGRCLAYISNKQVFLIDLNDISATPVRLADLPPERGTADSRLDKLQWRP